MFSYLTSKMCQFIVASYRMLELKSTNMNEHYEHGLKKNQAHISLLMNTLSVGCNLQMNCMKKRRNNFSIL